MPFASPESAPERRWFGVGRSAEADPGRAGAEAAAVALAHTDPKLVIVFCSESYDLRDLLDGIRSSSGDVPLIGCSTAGEIATSGPGDAGAVIVALGGEGFSVSTGIGRNASTRLREAGAEVAACVSALPPLEDRPHQVLLLQAEIEHVAERAGGSPVAGFYTYGEIARTRGVNGFHNQTLVVLAVG